MMWGKLCAVAIFAVVLSVHSTNAADNSKIVQALKNNVILVKNMIQQFKKTGSLSYSCKSGECQLCFKGQSSTSVCAKVIYSSSGDKKGFFTLVLGINGAETTMATIKGMPNGAVMCSSAVPDLCVRLKRVQTNLANETGKANICLEVVVAGNNIFHACVSGDKGRLTVQA